MPIGRSGFDHSLITVKGIIGSFYKTLEDELAGSWATRAGVLVPSNQSIETYRWLGHSPQLRQWLGARQAQGLPIRSFTIENQTYEATLGVDREDLRFDKTGQLQIRVAELAKRAADHWNKLATDLLTTNGLCWDGQNFFDTDHAPGDGSTYKNTLTASEVPALNVATAADPTPLEMTQAIINSIQYLYTFKDNQGEPYNDGARQFLVMVPPNMMGAATAAVRQNLINGGETNRVGIQPFMVDVAVNSRLSGTTVFYVFRLDTAMKPLILQEAVPPSMEFLGEGSDEAFKFNRYLFGVRAVRAASYGEWAHALKCTLS